MAQINFSEPRLLQRFDRDAFIFEHTIKDDARLSLESLAEIVASLPKEQVFHSRSDLDIRADFDRAHQEHKALVDLEAAFESLVSAESYIMVRQPDRHPKMHSLLLELKKEIESFIGATVLVDPMLYLFISSPRSITPFHLDRYSTFLFQVSGRKKVYVWPNTDRDVVSESMLEQLFSAPHERGPSLAKGFENTAQVFHLEPGKGVHIPFTAPHWVENEDEASVSFSVIFKTRKTQGLEYAYRVNHRLRGLGLKPRGVGERVALDSIKSFAYRAWLRARRRLGSTE